MNKSIRELRLLAEASVFVIGLLMSSGANADDDLMRTAKEIFHPIPSVIPEVKNNPITHETIQQDAVLRSAAIGKRDHQLQYVPQSRHRRSRCRSDLRRSRLEGRPTSGPHRLQRSVQYGAILGRTRRGPQGASHRPVQASAEMNATPDHVLDTLNSMASYVDLFKNAFPNEARPVTFENFAKSIEAFEATLITPAVPFDQYLEGNTHALNDQEKSGLALFMEKGCSTCHNGINVGGQAYFPFA
ncbi:hypothetical protein ABIC09_006724 [Bradyrhizobium sp. S3.12.5]